jgi:hypothetical protein
MSRVGLEPTTPVFERVKTVHASDRAATVIGSYSYVVVYFMILPMSEKIYFRIIGILEDNKLEWIWKEVVVAYSRYYPGIF